MNEYHDTTLTIIENRITELEWAIGDAGYEKALHIKNEIKVLKRIRKAHLEDVAKNTTIEIIDVKEI